MPTIEIKISGQTFSLRGDESEEHLKEVAELVRRRVENIQKKTPGISLHKATMLAAFDLASQLITSTRRHSDYRGAILTKAKLLLEKVETELSHRLA